MNKINVAILYPTRGRPEQAYSRVTELLEQTQPAGVHLSVVVCAESTDQQTVKIFKPLAETGDVTLLLRRPNTTSIYGWNQAYIAAKAAGADWVVLGADDVEFKPGWLKAALAAAGDRVQVVGLNDGHTNMPHYGAHFMATVSFLDEHVGGVIAPPGYSSWWNDREVCEKANESGLYAYTPAAVIEHHHPDWGLASMDETYEAAWPLHDADRELYQQRKAAGYPIDYGPAILEAKMWTAPENKMMPAPENKMVDVTAAALRILKEAGIDPATVKGTGADGRITKADAEKAVEDNK